MISNLHAKFLPLAHLHFMTAHQHLKCSIGFQPALQTSSCLTHPDMQFPSIALGAGPPSYGKQPVCCGFGATVGVMTVVKIDGPDPAGRSNPVAVNVKEVSLLILIVVNLPEMVVVLVVGMSTVVMVVPLYPLPPAVV